MRRGYKVDVFTRCDNALLPSIVKCQRNLRIVHVPAGPPKAIPKEELLPHMESFGTFLLDFFRQEAQPYDLVHANFFMSGWAALPVVQKLNLPLVMTFHALGHVRRLHQREADRFPLQRLEIEETLVQEAQRPDERARFRPADLAAGWRTAGQRP